MTAGTPGTAGSAGAAGGPSCTFTAASESVCADTLTTESCGDAASTTLTICEDIAPRVSAETALAIAECFEGIEAPCADTVDDEINACLEKALPAACDLGDATTANCETIRSTCTEEDFTQEMCEGWLGAFPTDEQTTITECADGFTFDCVESVLQCVADPAF